MKGVVGVTFEVLDEVKTVPTDYGPKPRCRVKISNGIETYEKAWTLNQQNTNFLIAQSKSNQSKEWIGQKVGIFTEVIKGNDSIRIKGVN